MAFLASTTLCLLLASGARAEETGEGTEQPPAVSPELAAAFADHLLSEGDPFNALTWYRLGLFLDPEGSDAPVLAFKVAFCYERGERWEAAQSAYLDVAGTWPEWSAQATWRAAMSARQAEVWPLARLYLQEIRLDTPDHPRAEQAAYMEALLSVQEQDLAKADQHLAAFSKAWPSSSLLPRVQATREVLARPVRHRSPLAAGLLSTAVPGLGQAYATHYGDGIMALLTSGGSAALAGTLILYGVESERGWATATGTGFAVLSGFFWTSQVVGAVRGARRANRLWTHQRADEAMEQGLHPDLDPTAWDVELEEIAP